jgi:hypothetical protein
MLIDVIKRAQQLRGEIPHLVQPSQADYDRVCMLTEVETLRAEVSALRTRAETAERERDEAYAKGQIDRTAEVETRLNTLARHLTIHAELSGPAVEDNAFQEAVSDVEVAIKDIFTLPIKERP